MKLYRNKKIKTKLVAFFFVVVFIVNWMEMNTENKVLRGEKEVCGGWMLCLLTIEGMVAVRRNSTAGEEQQWLWPISPRAILAFCQYKQWRKKKESLQRNTESDGRMSDYKVAFIHKIELFLEKTQWRMNKAKCEASILRNADKIIYHYKILLNCPENIIYE